MHSRTPGDPASAASSLERIRSNTRIEVIPLPSLARSLDDLEPGRRLSVTCSPAQGLDATVDLVARLRGLGHDAIPHIAARQLRSADHLDDVVRRCDDLGVTEVFLVGGDADPSLGPYRESLAVARRILQTSSGIRTMGFTGYPEGHEFISRDALFDALEAKQELIRECGIDAYVSTQMCFDAQSIIKWFLAIREQGIDLPIHVGLPGHVERLKLARISAKLGVRDSLKFFRKNKASTLKLMASSTYEPTALADEILGHSEVDITGFHVFSFNDLVSTERWLASYPGARDANRAG